MSFYRPEKRPFSLLQGHFSAKFARTMLLAVVLIVIFYNALGHPRVTLMLGGRLTSGLASIPRIESEIRVMRNGLVVHEMLVFQIQPEQTRSGFFRWLPYSLKMDDEKPLSLEYLDVSAYRVIDDVWVPADAETSFSRDGYRIRVKDTMEPGRHTFILSYKARFDEEQMRESGRARFRWDVTGKDWPDPIESVLATVIFQTGAHPDLINIKASVEAAANAVHDSSTTEGIQITMNREDVSRPVAIVSSARYIPARHGLVIDLTWPAGRIVGGGSH